MLSQGTLDLFVPKAVDQQVHHGIEKTIKQKKGLLLLLRVEGLGGHGHDDGTAKEEPDHAEVGGAGGEGLPGPSANWILRIAARMRA